MRGKILACLLSLLMLSASVLPVAPHFTLGQDVSRYPFSINNYDPHVSGPVGYVWPGVGLIGRGTLSQPEAPGYQHPWPNYPQHMKLRRGWTQLEGNAYSPFGAILTSTDDHHVRGDLLLGINYSQPASKQAYSWLRIWIPPEFANINKSRIVTTITNVYYSINASVCGKEDPIAPEWTLVEIVADSAHLITFAPYGPDRWYYVRINDVIAPMIAGKYFFKISLSNSSDVLVAGQSMIPTENWPALLVKGEVDPAIIWGTVRFGGWNSSLYGRPIRLPGRVRAVGMAGDPHTGKPTGRHVEARGYFNHTAEGHFQVEGVAPGVYDIYASAAGYPEQKIVGGVRVRRGQSLQIDGYLAPGVEIRGEVFSRCGTGEINWYYDRYPIKIEFYRTAAGAEVCDRSMETLAVAWSPYGPAVRQFPWWGLTPGDYPQGGLGIDYDGVGPPQAWVVSGSSTSFRFQFGESGKYGAPSEWDGHVPQRNATWVNGLSPGRYYMKAFTYGYVQVKPDGATFEHAVFNVSSLGWPGDARVFFNLRLSSIIQKTIHFHDRPEIRIETGILTSRYLYGEAVDKTGRTSAWKIRLVPAGATSTTIALHGFVNQTYFYGWGRNYGLEAGTYSVKTYMFGYLSPVVDLVTIGLCGSITQISNHMYKGVSFNLTVLAKDWQMPRMARPWIWNGQPIYVVIMNESGEQLDYTQAAQNSSRTFALTGLHSGREGGTADSEVGRYPISFGTGFYRFRVLTYGYVQKRDFSVWANAGNVTVDLALDVVAGANISFTMRFRHEGMFSHLIANSSVRVRVFDNASRLVGEWLTSDPMTPFQTLTETLNYVPFCTSWFNVTVAGLPSVYDPDPYFRFGYNETLLAPYGIDAHPNYRGGWSFEVEIVPWYGDVDGDGIADFFQPMLGILYGESPGYIRENHLGPYEFRYRIHVPGANLGGESSIVVCLDQLALLYGDVYCYTYCDDYRTTSWVAVAAEGPSGTFNYSTLDGTYAMWLPYGEYQLTITEWSQKGEGHIAQTHLVHLSDGQMGRFDVYLEQSSRPIPENLEWVQVLRWNFKDGFYPGGWYWGNWSIVDGKLEGQDLYVGKEDQSVYIFPFSHGADFIMETKVMIVRGTGARSAEAQLLTRDSPALNFESGMVLFAEGQRVDVRHMAHKTNYVYKTVNIESRVTYGTWHVIRFMAHNGKISAFVDGVLVYTSRNTYPVGTYLEPHLTVDEGIARFEYVKIFIIKSALNNAPVE